MSRILVVLALATAAPAAALVTATPAAAAPRKVLVLPVDGTADAGTRASLTARITRLASTLDGQVSTAEATFADTALAVGCRPQAPGCIDEVLATLGVDELVWGTATRDGGQTRLVVWHAVRGSAPREASATIAASAPPEQIDRGVAPLFPARRGGAEPPAPRPAAAPERPAVDRATEPVPSRPAEASMVPAEPAPEPAGPTDHRDRKLGIAFAAGGGVALGAGIALWLSYASTQDSIDNHPARTRADFDDLRSLEDRAATYAIAGDLLVIAGLAAGGVGAYYLFRDHRKHRVALAPAPIRDGAGLTLTWIGGL